MHTCTVCHSVCVCVCVCERERERERERETEEGECLLAKVVGQLSFCCCCHYVSLAVFGSFAVCARVNKLYKMSTVL